MYRGWQMSSKMSINDNVSLALQNYIKHHGLPPEVIETGLSAKEIPLPGGINLVVRSISIPANILLVGVDDETEEG